jgi:hypothetical protein
MANKDDKAQRLAAALRDNLRKRKAQARLHAGRETQGPGEAPPGPGKD